jgi:hypothetical protein
MGRQTATGDRMSYTQRDNSGSMFKNERKEKETHADYRGECLIDGKEYYMDVWLKVADSGRKWMSLSFKPKGGPKQQARQEPRRPQFDDSDIPF